MTTCAAAVTIGDPGGHFLPGLVRCADRLRSTFAGGGASIVDSTHPDVVRLVEDDLGWAVRLEPADGRVGLHRRRALELALEGAGDADGVLYSDVDHLLRWIEAAPSEVSSVARGAGASGEGPGMVVVGRSPSAMAETPARLRDTERIVNHVYGLVSGNRGWDVMFAIRRMIRAVAADVVAQCVEDSLANDVEWPLFAANAGHAVSYVASDHLTYRVREDFDRALDEHDLDPAKWIARIEIAVLHARVLERYL